MKFKLIFPFLVVLISLKAHSQNWQFGLGTGGWIHNQNTLKAFNKSIQSSIPFDTEITDNFPITPYFQGEVGYLFEQFYIGAIYTYNSTGSRITSTDYSGSYYYDLVLSGHLAGLSIGNYQPINKKWKLFYKADLGGIFSSLKMKESIIINNFDSNEDKIELIATSVYAKPNVQLSYELGKIKLNLSLAYLIDFKAPFHLENKKDAKLLDPSSGSEVKTSWHGLHFGLNIYYTFLSNRFGE